MDTVAESNEQTTEVQLLNHTCTQMMPVTFTVVQAISFKREFQATLQANPDIQQMVLDFSQTNFMDSSGIGALVGCWKLAQKHNAKLILLNVSTPVRTILALADVEQLFEFAQAEPAPVAVTPPAASPAVAPPPRQRLPKRAADVPFVTHPSVKSRLKRVMDIAGALVGLGITGVLLVPIAIAIKLDSPGPIFFGQTRCSWMGRRFKMWKFRSMVVDAERRKHLVKNEAEGALFKNSHDPRITRVGRFLRRTSLDELPQFWNVLRGDMSLVGTRPPTPDEVERYEIPQWQRLDIKPGMTGEWQVHGRSQVKNFEDVVQLDLRYQENWSLAYDVKLILKTIWVIFNKNAGAM